MIRLRLFGPARPEHLCNGGSVIVFVLLARDFFRLVKE